MTNTKYSVPSPYPLDQALMGPDSPPMKSIVDLIRYCLTIHIRFGDTCIDGVKFSWGGSALNNIDRSKKDTARMDYLENAPMNEKQDFFLSNAEITRQTIDAAMAADKEK